MEHIFTCGWDEKRRDYKPNSNSVAPYKEGMVMQLDRDKFWLESVPE